jgi:hypothetical protein
MRPLDRCCHRPECRPFHARRPRLTSFRPQAFSASRRFTPHLGVLGLFHPKTTSRVHSCSGRFSSSVAVLTLRQVVPPCRWSRVPHRPKPAANTHSLDFEVLLHRRPRSSSLVLPAPSVAALFRFLAPPGSALPTMTLVTQSQSLMTLRACLPKLAYSLVSSVLSSTSLPDPSPDWQTRSSFRAYDSIFKELEPLRLARI